MGDTPIDVAYPTAEVPHLRIAVGACRLTAGPHGGEGWVIGNYHDPTDRRPIKVIEEAGGASITEAKPTFGRLPAVLGGASDYDLEIGKERSFALTIETGASDFDLDLGGVPLSRLVVKQGAGKFEMDFPQPNPERMELLDITTGAVGLELENLANANFSEMRLSGGAASYDLDFGGTLAHDALVTIETGVSAMTVSVPATTATRVFAETTLGTVDVGDGFTKKEGFFLTEAALGGVGPVLTIRAGIQLGSLQLRTA
jgi:hypothetical protein